MGRTTIIASQKGGVAKTTTALNLGFSLSRFGGSVLIIDADPQGSLAVATNLKKRTNKGIIDVLKGSATAREVTATTRDQSLAIVGMGSPNSDEVLLLEEEARNGNLGVVVRSLAQEYQHTIIDAPSGIGSTVTTLMGASDGVILPIHTRALSIKTLPSFLRAMQWTRENLNRSLRLDGVLLTMVDENNPMERQAFDDVRALFSEDIFFNTWIGLNPLYEEATAQCVPIALLPQGQQAARAYIDLAFEFMTKTAAEGARDEEITGLF